MFDRQRMGNSDAKASKRVRIRRRLLVAVHVDEDLVVLDLPEVGLEIDA